MEGAYNFYDRLRRNQRWKWALPLDLRDSALCGLGTSPGLLPEPRCVSLDALNVSGPLTSESSAQEVRRNSGGQVLVTSSPKPSPRILGQLLDPSIVDPIIRSAGKMTPFSGNSLEGHGQVLESAVSAFEYVSENHRLHTPFVRTAMYCPRNPGNCKNGLIGYLFL